MTNKKSSVHLWLKFYLLRMASFRLAQGKLACHAYRMASPSLPTSIMGKAQHFNVLSLIAFTRLFLYLFSSRMSVAR
jgi:hypothetical protein